MLQECGQAASNVWTDKRDVKLLSTFHDNSLAPTGKMDMQTELLVMEPQPVLESNEQMGWHRHLGYDDKFASHP